MSGRALEVALLVALATLLAKTAVIADESRLAGPLVAGALLGWLWLFRRVRTWASDDLANVGRR